MSDITGAETFVDGVTNNVTAAKLNNHVNAAVIQPGFVSTKTGITPVAGDYILVFRTSTSQLNKSTLTNIYAPVTGTAAAVAGLRVLGTGALEAAAGNDTRFSASVTGLRKSAGGGSTDTAAVSGTDYGYVGIPQNAQNAAYTFVAGDANKHIYHNEATARIYTIPSNAAVAYAIGTTIVIVNTAASGAITLMITTDTLQRGDGTAGTGSRTIPAAAVATILKTATTTWYVTGTYT